MRLARALAFQIWLVAVTAVMLIVFMPLLAAPRRWLNGPYRLWTRLILGGFERIVGVRTELRGLERLPPEPVLVASKHQAMWDTVIFNTLLRDPVLVLKRELLSIPVYGWYARKFGMIPVDRGAHARALRGMVRAARERFARGRSIIIYPEGTRARPGAANPYRPGVAALYRQLDCPCVPVALTSGLCWPRSGLGFHPGLIILEILDPIPPGLNRREFMAELEARIESATAHLLAEARADTERAPAAAE
ncbi:MAG: lysophospholipid acyltransferase family protein [Alphaproteobacteria bacterium]